MSNTALGRTEIALLTNKAGVALAQGDVVIVDTANAAAVTTTTTSAYVSGRVGVVIEPNGIANNALGLVAFGGYVPVINLSGTGSIGDMVKTHTVAKQGVRHASPQVAGDFAQVLGTTATPAALLFGTVQLGGGTGETGRIPIDGWVAGTGTWSYTSADAPTFVASIPDADAANMNVGARLKLTQTTAKYFIVTAKGSPSGGFTPVTIYGGTDYTLANAAITSPYYSPVKAPLDFPLSPAKWTVEVSDVTQRTQATPVNGTWYNLGTLTISIPIGIWEVAYDVTPQFADASATQWQIFVTLSTANNSESDVDFTTALSGGSILNAYSTLRRVKVLTLAAKTSYYLNTKVNSANLDNLYNRNDNSKAFIRAVCAYL
jgi:hypothetical protein